MAEFQIKPTVNFVDMTVVVGRATVLASKEAPHAKALAVPSSVISMMRLLPATGVPERFVVKEVMA